MQKFAGGDKVNISGLDADTGITAEGLAIATLKDPGLVLESREHPPHIDAGAASPSPHCLVVLKTASGDDAEAWFATSRLSKAN